MESLSLFSFENWNHSVWGPPTCPSCANAKAKPRTDDVSPVQEKNFIEAFGVGKINEKYKLILMA